MAVSPDLVHHKINIGHKEMNFLTWKICLFSNYSTWHWNFSLFVALHVLYLVFYLTQLVLALHLQPITVSRILVM